MANKKEFEHKFKIGEEIEFPHGSSMKAGKITSITYREESRGRPHRNTNIVISYEIQPMKDKREVITRKEKDIRALG